MLTLKMLRTYSRSAASSSNPDSATYAVALPRISATTSGISLTAEDGDPDLPERPLFDDALRPADVFFAFFGVVLADAALLSLWRVRRQSSGDRNTSALNRTG